MFYERVKSLCQEHDMTVTDLLNNLAMSPSNNTRWSKGAIPDGNTLVKLAKYFDVSTDYLLGIDDVKKRLFDMLDTPLDFQDPQLRALTEYFSKCNPNSQLRIIQFALNEYDRNEEERKKDAERAVAKIKFN